MDDIVETRDDLEEIEWFKKHLAIEFDIKYLGRLGTSWVLRSLIRASLFQNKSMSLIS